MRGKDMKKEYIAIVRPTKEDLDKIKVGDLVKCNDWVKPLIVKGVSDNYFIMVRNHFGKPLYSICEKTPSAFSRNSIVESYPTIGTDFWIFGKFDYFNQEDIEQCLDELESGKTELSVRSSVALKVIQYKR